MPADRVLVVGAGLGGLAAAADLARKGFEVVVLERAPAVGGKMRQVHLGGKAGIDAGPTVFTMRWVFEELFADAGQSLEQSLDLEPLSVLARHVWHDAGPLDLYADRYRSAEAIATFAGSAEANGYLAFCKRSAEIFGTLKDSYIAAQRPTALGLTSSVGLARLPALWRTAPFQTLWSALGRYFSDPRLRQLFARYATYVGSSPFQAPATLMLIAHVEQEGVWHVKGGMWRLAQAMQQLAELQGAQFRLGTEVRELKVKGRRVVGAVLADGEVIESSAVVFNGDTTALSAGLLGRQAVRGVEHGRPPTRSLSAVTWCLTAKTSGFALTHHNVFFARDYHREFSAIFRDQEISQEPTVYICAQDRNDDAGMRGSERLFLLINAPARTDRRIDYDQQLERVLRFLEGCGLSINIEEKAVAGPKEFADLFPGNEGALYGPANHGPFGSFARPGAKGRLGGLYLAGGSVHPGAGVPMATLSGRRAAERLIADLRST